MAFLPFRRIPRRLCPLFLFLSVSLPPSRAQEAAPIDTPPPIRGLPDPFLRSDGSRIQSGRDWPGQRDRIRELLLQQVYGHAPNGPFAVRALDETRTLRDEGRAAEVTFTLEVSGGTKPFRMRCGMVIPTVGGPRFPVVLAIDPVWQPHVAATARQVNSRGHALAGFVYHDVDDDDADRSDGVYPCFPGATNDWATLAAWAWAASRLADHLVTRDDVDGGKLAVTGHSRCGKAALLAGALDGRFRLTAPHASGAGGAGSFRIRPKGVETLELITDPKRFHYWFHPNLRSFAGNEDRMPFDQHFLKALVAPRALLTLEAEGDLWSNPLGTWQTHLAAREVYRFLGVAPAIRCWFRPGGHDPTSGDWDALLDVADEVFRGKPLPPGKGFERNPFPGEAPAFGWSAHAGQ